MSAPPLPLPLRLVLADDHALVRAGMLALLGELPGVTVVAETGDGREALRLIRERKPDIALLDISMPGLNGLEVAARVTQEHPATHVIIVSMHGDDESVRRALVAGAAGYLLKNADKSELEMALNTVARGDTWLSPPLTKRVVAAFKQNGGGALEVLTPRQREVLQLVAEGHSNKEIASRLNVALKTVETHRTELMDRLGIHGVAGLVRYAIQVGLVHPDSPAPK